MSVGSQNRRQFLHLFSDAIPFKAPVDFASAADAETQGANVTVAGAALGDFVLIAPGVDVADLTLDARVTAADTVTVTVNNNTGGAVNLASQTIKGVVLKEGEAFKHL